MTNNTNKSELSQSERDAFKTAGRIGGKAFFKKHGKKQMSELGRRGAKARWGSKTKSVK